MSDMICRVCQKPLTAQARCGDPEGPGCVHRDCARQVMADREQQAAHWSRVGPGLLAALEALEYRDDPGRFCDHPAEPCERCYAAWKAVRAAKESP